MQEAAEYYCTSAAYGNVCARGDGDCSHIPGCTRCKEGSGIWSPGVMDNCLACAEGFHFIDGGFDDCTGTCVSDSLAKAEPAAAGWADFDTQLSLAELDDRYAMPQGGSRCAPLPASPQSCGAEKCTGAYAECAPAAQRCRCREGFLPDRERGGECSPRAPPLVVAVTTMPPPRRDDRAQQAQLRQRAAAATWLVLAPDLVVETAVDADYEVPPPLPRLQCGGNRGGTPFVADLFRRAEERARAVGSPFAGFFNSDIGFDTSLLEVLQQVRRQLERGQVVPRTLVIGRRLNLGKGWAATAPLLDAVAQNATLPLQAQRRAVQAALDSMRHLRGTTLMMPMAQDYFFFTPGTFNWTDIPNYIIGRVGYDSFLTQWAVDNGVDVIDASATLHAVHLTDESGNAAGWRTRRQDRLWNYCALHHQCTTRREDHRMLCGACFRCKMGSVAQASHETVRAGSDTGSSVGIHRRVDRVLDERAKQVAWEAELKQTRKTLLEHAVGTNTTLAEELAHGVKEEPNCVAKRSCCSFGRTHAAEYELGMRFDVRSEWPYSGTYSDVDVDDRV